MKKVLLAFAVFLLAGLSAGFAQPAISQGATKWCDWTGPGVGSSTNFYANGGTSAVAADGNGLFGQGVGEVTFTSNNPAPVAEHQFGNSIWGPARNIALFDAAALKGRTGLEMLVHIDPTSTSGKICMKLKASTPDEVYVQTVTVEKGSIQCVRFPLSGFKGAKNPEAVLADFSTLDGTIQITDGWNGYPQPAQAVWICKFSNIYTYTAPEGNAAASPGWR